MERTWLKKVLLSSVSKVANIPVTTEVVVTSLSEHEAFEASVKESEAHTHPIIALLVLLAKCVFFAVVYGGKLLISIAPLAALAVPEEREIDETEVYLNKYKTPGGYDPYNLQGKW